MSNLLDKASIILTPTAYNNGEALCVKPSDGSGDFDFSRNSAATRVNAQGLVENVQILSSNLVQNGDFSEEGVQEVSNGSFSQEGAELVTNGSFDTDSDWTILNSAGATTNISGGALNIVTDGVFTQASQDGILTSGKSYVLDYTITSNAVVGSLAIVGGSANLVVPSTVGTHSFYFEADGAGFAFKRGGGALNVSIDNCSVREVGQDWTLGTGWSIAEDKAISDGTSGNLYQSGIIVSGKQYKIQATVSDYVSGNVEVSAGAVPRGTMSANGTYTFYQTASSTINFFVISNSFIGSITNISVKEVGMDWVFQAKWSIGSGFAQLISNDSAASSLIPNTSTISGNKYNCSFDAVVSSGSCKLQASSGTAYQIIDETKTYNFNFVADSGGIYFNRLSAISNITITNVNIVLITSDTNLPRISYENFSYQDALGSELVVNGDFATDSDWAKGTGWSISGGSANGLATLDPIRQVISGFTDSKKYKVSFEITEVTNGFVRVYSYVGASGTFTKVLETPSQIGTYEVIFEFGGTNKNLMFYGSIGNGNFTGSIDNVSVKEYLGQEVVPDSGCGSWLFEPQSTNIITQSELFSDASWQKFRVSITPNTLIAPNGKLAANSLIEDTTNNTHVLRYAITPNSNSYTFSVFVKSLSGNRKLVMNSSDVNSFAVFDIENGVIESEQNIDASSIEDYGNGWYRCSVTKDNNTSENFDIRLNNGSTNTYIGDGTSGVYIWGAMLEENSYPTSLIPTSGSTVTRNQDVCANGGSLATINSTEGTLYAEIAALADDETNREIALSDGTTTNYVLIRFNSGGSNRIYTRVDVGGAIQYFDLEFSIDITNTTKIAIRYGDNNFATFINGSKVSSQLSGIAFGANTLTELAFDNGSGGANFFGKTKCVAVWKEALSDSELQSLTTI